MRPRPRPKLWGQGWGQNHKAEVETKSSRPRPATGRYFWIRTHSNNANNTTEFVCPIIVFNHVFVMNVAIFKSQTNTTNIILHWIAHFWGHVNKTEARQRRNPWGWGQLVEAEVKNLALKPIWPRGPNITAFYNMDALHVAQPTVSEHRMENSQSYHKTKIKSFLHTCSKYINISGPALSCYKHN